MIENQKDLKALLKLCRSQGVTEITLDKTHIKFGEMARSVSGDIGQDEEISEAEFMTAIEAPITPEEMTAFANGGEIN